MPNLSTENPYFNESNSALSNTKSQVDATNPETQPTPGNQEDSTVEESLAKIMKKSLSRRQLIQRAATMAGGLGVLGLVGYAAMTPTAEEELSAQNPPPTEPPRATDTPEPTPEPTLEAPKSPEQQSIEQTWQLVQELLKQDGLDYPKALSLIPAAKKFGLEATLHFYNEAYTEITTSEPDEKSELDKRTEGSYSASTITATAMEKGLTPKDAAKMINDVKSIDKNDTGNPHLANIALRYGVTAQEASKFQIELAQKLDISPEHALTLLGIAYSDQTADRVVKTMSQVQSGTYQELVAKKPGIDETLTAVACISGKPVKEVLQIFLDMKQALMSGFVRQPDEVAAQLAVITAIGGSPPEEVAQMYFNFLDKLGGYRDVAPTAASLTLQAETSPLSTQDIAQITEISNNSALWYWFFFIR